jgi:serine/threonine protein kinase
LEFIGQGGMGFVFKARQPKLDRLVALKILPQSLAADPTFAERFNREAKLLARLNHPGIVTVHDFGVATATEGRAGSPLPAAREGGNDRRARSDAPYPPQTPDAKRQSQFYYLLMEFVDGVNLRQAMQAGRFTPDQALAIVPKICEALQFAHNEGILHRDIKPENILLDAKGRVKIADFGIAMLMGNDTPRFGVPPLGGSVSPEPDRLKPGLQAHYIALTEAGKTLGSPNYMAPEQLENPGEVDHRADIYSLGVVFYEMLTGELPLGRFAPPSQKSAADPRVDEVVLRALEKERERRQHSAGEVKTQVETIVSTPGSSRREEAQTEQFENASLETGPAGFLSRWRRMVALLLGGITFTSPLSVKLTDISALGILGCISCLGLLAPVFPAMRVCFAFGAFFGFFGLIGIVAMLEFPAARRRARAKKMSQTPRVTPDANLPSAPMNCPVTMEKWLAMMDAGEYAQSWETAAPYFQGKISREEWLAKLEQVRRSLGEILSRKIISMENTVMGTRYEAKYASAFECLPAAVETVTYAKQPGGAWLPIGYLIRPAEPGRARFSRTAIVGAAWLTLFFAVVPAFLWHEIATHEPIRLNDPIWIIVLFALGLPGFTAPFGATILGWVAVSQIRRSAGKLYGLWLAVFDGLLFPLLALDAGLLAVCMVATVAITGTNSPENQARAVCMLVWVLLSLTIDWLIIRRVWRAVSNPQGSAKEATTAPAAPHLSKRGPLALVWGASLVGVLVMATLAIYWQARPTATLLARNMLTTTATDYVVANATHAVLDEVRPVRLDARGAARLPDGSTEDKTIVEWGKRTGEVQESFLSFDDFKGGRVTIHQFRKAPRDTLITWEYAGGDPQDISVIIQKNLAKSGVVLTNGRGSAVLLAAVFIAVLIGVLIIRRVWRAVNPVNRAALEPSDHASPRLANWKLALLFGVVVGGGMAGERLISDYLVRRAGAPIAQEAARQAITPHLQAASLRWETMSFEPNTVSPSDVIVRFTKLEKLREASGTNIWQPVDGLLNLRTLDGSLW